MGDRRILHAADIHLDSPLQKLDQYENAPVDRIRGATRRAMESLTRLAIEEQVDLVVIAGDLYDGDWVDQNTGLAFVGQAAKLVRAGIPLLVIRGNHDAANQMTASLPLPKNPDGSEIFLQTGQPETRLFEDLGFAVHGQSFRSRAERANLAERYPPPVTGMFNLGLLHTGLEGDSGHAHYAPCTAAQLTDKQYDYWALGHIHQRGDYALEGGAPIVFSGNIQGRHIRESGPKGCLLLEVDAKNRCRYEFHALDVVRWQQCTIDVSPLKHRDEICDRYQSWLATQIDSADGRLLVARVRLQGATRLHASLHQHQAALRADLQSISVAFGADQVWLEDVKVRTKLPAEGGVRAEMEGPLESFAHVVEELRQSSDLASVIGAELNPLGRKLPKELLGESEQAAFPMTDPEWIEELFSAASADVLGRLQPTEDQAADAAEHHDRSQEAT
ncbi:DNA repair exonuclease [Roseiconus nitratireducens]|uniref:DNA repair exonuclease n=1 Tax=Roseiconus nitratireducens TaxID=2605748 RepID=A0A5M6D9X7_9BACT|nr:DNA repair exonuclease [Roseiconus nitratireducens]KAA5543230.1 DNA repair exonuclease [Roseiconus nitratireducens]